MADHGFDFSGVTALDRNLTVVWGRRCLAENVARRLLALPGSEPDDPSYGLGLGNVIGEDVPTKFLELQAEEQVLSDERVTSAEIAASFDEATGLGTLDIDLDDGDGPFTFTVSPAGLTVDLLKLRSP